jgi:hypothetical protein
VIDGVRGCTPKAPFFRAAGGSQSESSTLENRVAKGHGKSGTTFLFSLPPPPPHTRGAQGLNRVSPWGPRKARRRKSPKSARPSPPLLRRSPASHAPIARREHLHTSAQEKKMRAQKTKTKSSLHPLCFTRRPSKKKSKKSKKEEASFSSSSSDSSDDDSENSEEIRRQRATKMVRAVNVNKKSDPAAQIDGTFWFFGALPSQTSDLVPLNQQTTAREALHTRTLSLSLLLVPARSLSAR